ncbi:MAG: TonB-dependent receptor [Bacteroidales bacterium]|nr:MAG: TonB-dependent receptor [Bacteroidales bacterium]
MRNTSLWKIATLSLLLFSFGVNLVFTQVKTVTGKVASEYGEALSGVIIEIPGTTQRIITDAEGNYSIEVPGPDAALVFSFAGFTTQTIKVGTQSVINIVLVPDIALLNENVVTAYAIQRSRDLTGSVGIVQSGDLVRMPQGNVTQQLQGRVAGVNVTLDSRPGQPAKVRIRGFGSFRNNSPLYVVDGVPVTDINTLNPGDIESLTVLKDAGAASVYGSRASNGVIVVATKKGQRGLEVNYNMYYGTQRPGSGPGNMCSAQDYADLTWLIYSNDGTAGEVHPIYGSTLNPEPILPFWADDTNWWDEVTDPAPIMNHDLSLSGGTENSRYYASIGYFDQQGTVIRNWWKRWSARFNSDFTIRDRVTIGENLNIVHRSDNGVAANGSEGTALMMGVYRQQSIIPVIWDDDTWVGPSRTWENGDFGGTGIESRLGNGSNYVATRYRDRHDRWQDIRLLGNLYADVKIIEGLNFRSSFGGSMNNWYTTNWTGVTYEDSENVSTASYSEGSGYGREWTWTNTLTLARQFGNHNILAVAGYEAVKTGIGRNLSTAKAGYFSESLSYRTVTNGITLQSGNSGYWTPRTLVSQFVRADYNLMNKYYLSATVRRDGSSVFGPDTRYGIFPSVSAGWRISDETFLAGVGFISDLKIRGGYGTMGNQRPVSTANQFYLYGTSTSTSYYDVTGTGTSSEQGFRPTRIGNPDAKWETQETANVGFDAVLFERKFEIYFDWYTKQNKELLFNPELPGTAGAASRPYVNVGEMKNTGIDVNVVYRQIFSDFSLEASAQFTSYNNEIVKIAEGVPYFDSGGSRIGSFNRNLPGEALGSFWGYEVMGLFQEADVNWVVDKWVLVDGIPDQDGAEPGFFRYKNNDDSDDEITPDDRTIIGNPNPDFTYGFNLMLGYKGFDLTAFFYGSYGNEIFNYNKWWLDFWPSFQGQKSTELLNSSWTTANTGASVPKASNKSNFSTNTVSNSYYIEDGSYLRLKNLQIGYTLPRSIMGNVFNNVRIYVQAVNLLTITDYSGMDPELASFNDTYMGVDEGNLPATKQYLIGVSLGF